MNGLTLGTAGHVDHGKTALVRALTGRDTDRLAEERRRGMSIELGYAPLDLGHERVVSVVDVPGHERFVRTMVAGATGIDLALLCVAADDGVMPQTREHLAVLRALAVPCPVVAVTKADLADPARAGEEVAELLPEAVRVPVVATRGEGVDALRDALARACSSVVPRGSEAGGPVLHVDRSFSMHGAGTVLTGTLWSGAIARGDRLVVLRGDREALEVRVRGVQVHDEALERAEAGRRVAVNVVGTSWRDVARGDVLAAPGADLDRSWILDVALDLRVGHGSHVVVHHGTRETPARVAWLGGPFHQIRAERPLAARRGDRLVLRSTSPPDTLGGGVVLDARARKHGTSNDVVIHLRHLLDRTEGSVPPVRPEVPPRTGGSVPPVQPGGTHRKAAGPGRTEGSDPPVREEVAVAVANRFREAGWEPPGDAELDEEERAALGFLREAGRLVRLGPSGHVHARVLAEVEERVRAIVEAEGSVTIARLRDELGTSRRRAQLLLERLDAERVTLRVGDERVLRRRGG